MANVAFGILGSGVIVGFNSTMASFVPQSFGKGDLYSCGAYLSKARLLIFLIQVFCNSLLLYLGAFYKFLGIDPATADSA
jgi:hypothetical protein